MSTILIIVVLVLLFGGGYYARGRSGGGGLGGVLGLVLLLSWRSGSSAHSPAARRVRTSDRTFRGRPPRLFA
jgi:hypothetical protein